MTDETFVHLFRLLRLERPSGKREKERMNLDHDYLEFFSRDCLTQRLVYTVRGVSKG